MAVLIGGAGYGVSVLLKTPVADPLIISLLMGFIARSIIGEDSALEPGITLAPALFLPIGIIFYGARNLNFYHLAEMDKGIILLLAAIMIVYFAVILILGHFLGQKKQITYLTASGSAICGASAIAVTSPAVQADPDDISISLLAVSLAALVGFAIIIPFMAALFNLSCDDYCMLSGSTLQFTGLVKASGTFVPFIRNDTGLTEATTSALSVKAMRYLGLFVSVPVFASLVRKKIHVPWFLWAFFGAGLFGTLLSAHSQSFFNTAVLPSLKIIHIVSWSIAMAAVGLNAHIKGLLSNNGSKAIIMAFAGFIAAITAFFCGISLMNSF